MAKIFVAIKKFPFLNKLLLFLWHKFHNGKRVRFWYSTHISYHCQFEGMNHVGKYSSFWGAMGYGSSIGWNSSVSADIGRFTSIGPRCGYINSSHPYKKPFATTCPLFYSLVKGRNPQNFSFTDKQLFEEFRYYDKDRELVNDIGNDCWIGSDVTLIGGVKIGDGAVVLAHALVSKDVPPFAIVGGVPAKIIGYRYDEETIAFLLEHKWWDKDIEWFNGHWNLLCDIDKLKAYFNEED